LSFGKYVAAQLAARALEAGSRLADSPREVGIDGPLRWRLARRRLRWTAAGRYAAEIA
jgi:hypothetical protein